MSTAYSDTQGTRTNQPAPRRYLAVWFPYLSADRLRRQEKQETGRQTPTASSTSPRRGKPGRGKRAAPPRVFAEKLKSALRIVATDRKAERLGLHPGLAVADARARVPNIDVVEMDRSADVVFLEALADFCDRYTPLVALDPPDGLVLDVTGCAHLFAGEDGLHADLLDRLTRGGVEAHATIAGTPDTARALARFADIAIVSPGREKEAVAPLPIAALDIEAESVKGLVRAGLKTIAAIANEPRQPLAARFGATLVNRLARVLGEKDARIRARRPLPPCVAEQRFAEPIGAESDILMSLKNLAAETGDILLRRGEGGRLFAAAFYRTDGTVRRLGVETGRPVRDPATLERLFRERLDSLIDPLDPGFGFDLIRLEVTATDTFVPAQTGLDNTIVEDEEVAALVDRLATRFGTGAVLRFVAHDTHIPERAASAVPAIDLEGTRAHWPAPDPDAPVRPVHMFAPPQPITTMAEVPDGPPLRFRWRKVLHQIVRAEGPERITPEWWRTPAPARDYYRIEDMEGRRYWVFREGLYDSEGAAPRWFLHGIFP